MVLLRHSVCVLPAQEVSHMHVRVKAVLEDWEPELLFVRSS